MKVLAIIPARGGSKGVPGKNIAEVDGQPLISYTIEAALESKQLTAIYVSSDDERILSLANKPGIHLHYRPAGLATDDSPVTATVEQVLHIAEQEFQLTFDVIMLLQPTAPIREPQHIEEAISLLQAPEYNSVISVCEMEDVHPARMYQLEGDALQPYFPEMEQKRRQDLPKAYFRNGSIYLVRRNAFLQDHSLMAKPSCPYVMPSKYLANVDDHRDLIITRALVRAWKNGEL